VENHVDAKDSAVRITYAGYKVPHPLRLEMFVRIGMETATPVPGEQETQTARKAVASVCRTLRDTFRTLEASWMAT
jgi:DNA-directed RNA polymerase subunit L